jgi:hypothetical protein
MMHDVVTNSMCPPAWWLLFQLNEEELIEAKLGIKQNLTKKTSTKKTSTKKNLTKKNSTKKNLSKRIPRKQFCFDT